MVFWALNAFHISLRNLIFYEKFHNVKVKKKPLIQMPRIALYQMSFSIMDLMLSN